MALFRDMIAMFFGEKVADKMAGPASPRVVQKGNLVGGHMVGGSMDIDLSGASVGRIQSGGIVTRRIRCQGDLCIRNGVLSIGGVRYELVGKNPVILRINGQDYEPWDTSASPCPPPDKAYSPWEGEVNGHQIVVRADSLSVDGVEYRR